MVWLRRAAGMGSAWARWGSLLVVVAVVAARLGRIVAIVAMGGNWGSVGQSSWGRPGAKSWLGCCCGGGA